MNLSDITKINFGSAGISAVYNGGIKLWPQEAESNKVMKFTIVSGDTWTNRMISAYTADNTYITPVVKDATGWTYDEEVGYLSSDFNSSDNLLTFEGFPRAVKIKSGLGLFDDNDKCTDISAINLDVSECTTVRGMFNGCNSLISLDLSNWNTSNVTSMRAMFGSCGKLATLDVSNFDTSKVTDMGSMFSGCGGLTSLNLSNFNTSKVNDIGMMFYDCRGLATLDLSNWDISKVTSIDSMFNNCSALRTVKMLNCSQATVDKIRSSVEAAGYLNNVEFIVDDGIALD